MGVKDLFTWYQKKIDSKQKWETTIEEKILCGLTHVPMKNTKPNTDFIDLDWVRGSSFSKVKPKHGFITVARLATLRCIFLPIYAKWWKKQTPYAFFVVMYGLYISQMVNIAIYYMNSHKVVEDKSQENITCMELLIPLFMTWVLSLVHSQIAATMPSTDSQKSNSKSRTAMRRKIANWRNLFGHSLKTRVSPKNRRINFNLAANTEVSGRKVEELVNTNKGPRNRRYNRDKPQAEDDGFESLNGNGSRTSEEEVASSPRLNDVLMTSRQRCDAWFNRQKEISAKFNNRVPVSTDESEGDTESVEMDTSKRSKYRIPVISVTSIDSSDDEWMNGCEKKSPAKSADWVNEWMTVTTNSEDCSYSSELDDVLDGHLGVKHADTAECDNDVDSNSVFNGPAIKVSCIIWDKNEIKKAELSMLDISSAIIRKVESTSQSMDYFYFGIIISTIHALMPVMFRLCSFALKSSAGTDGQYSIFELSNSIIEKLPNSTGTLLDAAFGATLWERAIIIPACLQRWFLANHFFFLLVVAENTFNQRFLYAKLFSHLTSSRRAKQSELPHFRLNKVRNIKTWLSVRAYLKQRGPQRSVDVIVSTAFVITLLLLSFLCVEFLKETGALNSQYHVEALILCIGVGILLLRFMTLGTKINKKYRNLSVLITEQINLHLQIEQKPQKKDELSLANNVLKLAIDLIKEIQSPFQISGFSANSILYNTTKLIILSALSGILSELLGFKLKLDKIKIK